MKQKLQEAWIAFVLTRFSGTATRLGGQVWRSGCERIASLAAPGGSHTQPVTASTASITDLSCSGALLWGLGEGPLVRTSTGSQDLARDWDVYKSHSQSPLICPTADTCNLTTIAWRRPHSKRSERVSEPSACGSVQHFPTFTKAEVHVCTSRNSNRSSALSRNVAFSLCEAGAGVLKLLSEFCAAG